MKMNYEADLACNEARRNSFKKNRERRKLDIQNSADSKVFKQFYLKLLSKVHSIVIFYLLFRVL